MAHKFSSHLLGKTRESTFDTLYTLYDGRWHQQDDIVHLFHDDRCNDDGRYALVESVWTFDLDNDILRIDGKECCGQIHLERVRQGPFQIADVSPQVTAARPTNIPQAALPPPYAQLTRTNQNLSLHQRQKAFLCRILQDFAFQLAYAVIRILALDFTVKEINIPYRASGGHLVRLQDLPRWKACNEDLVQVGGVSIVISQHTSHALNLAKADFRKWAAGRMKGHMHHASDDVRTYLLFSRHSVSLYQRKNDTEKHTRPEPLLDTTPNFTAAAIALLLEATQQSVSEHWIQSVPSELQDMILEKAAVGPIERAKLGCVLNVGSVFKWQCDGRNIERELADRHRVLSTRIESRVYFDDCFTGLAYK
ncbi:hypothetical protein OPT61_g7848 [Boeremia exigua]|uniref:Uncharacterized protein n=1 Tax=Boeremia exigua TaxID=749465 RepID=A0ACC2I176_9PLEO|nr:hypothetical protein OPT61_g7848 [Boeremia exigua]